MPGQGFENVSAAFAEERNLQGLYSGATTLEPPSAMLDIAGQNWSEEARVIQRRGDLKPNGRLL